MLFWGWGRRTLTRQLDETNAIIRTYRYAHIFFLFTLAWGGEYSLATRTDVGWARRPIAKEDAVRLLGGKPLQPTLWRRFSLILAAVVVAVVGISSAVARSSTTLSGHTGSQQAWGNYFGATNGAIDQLNTLGNEPLSPSVLASTIGLLKTLENSPDDSLNGAIGNAVDTCETNVNACNAAIDNAGRAYNSALEEAGREGLVHVTGGNP